MDGGSRDLVLARLRSLGFDCQVHGDGKTVIITDRDRPTRPVTLVLPVDLFEELMASREPYADDYPPEQRDERVLDDQVLDLVYTMEADPPLISATLSRSRRGPRWDEVREPMEDLGGILPGASWWANPPVDGSRLES